MTLKKIIYLVSEDWYFYSHRLNLAEESMKHNFKVYLLTNVGDCKQIIENKGIEVIPLRFLKRSRINFVLELFSICEILFLLLKIKPNILHSVAIKPVIYGSLASLFLRKILNINALGGLGFIYSSGSLKARILRPLIFNVLKYISNRKKSKLIVQNKDDYIFVTKRLKINKNNIRLIESAGVDLDKFSVNQKNIDSPLVLMASRMLWDKGVGDFYKAAGFIKKKGINARFVLVGKPDEENPNSISIKQLSIWDKSGIIEWWGFRSDMINVFKEASIVTLPSYYGEGIPKVLVEAMACSKAIVTTDMPGCRELVIDGSNGLLVKPKNYIDLAKALESLILNPKLSEEMGQKGREIASLKYDQRKIVAETINLYLI